MKDRLNKIFSKVLGEDISLAEETRLEDIEDLDSIEYVDLIEAVEKEFGIKFKMREVSSMKTVGEMLTLIREKQ